MNAALIAADGSVLSSDVQSWLAAPSVGDHRLLEQVEGPALDIGCGPGRHLRALSERGVVALGVDVAPAAVALARKRGAIALQRSVFDPIPGAGRWRCALLLDGNIGIGGDPRRLLGRVRELLRFDGDLLAEVDPPEVPSGRLPARLEVGPSASEWFPWARVSAGDLPTLASETGFRLTRLWRDDRRWFGKLCVAS